MSYNKKKLISPRKPGGQGVRVSGHRQPVQQQAHPRPHHTEENWCVYCLSITARVAPDIRPFLMSGIRPDIRQTKPDIRPEKLYMVYSFFRT